MSEEEEEMLYNAVQDGFAKVILRICPDAPATIAFYALANCLCISAVGLVGKEDAPELISRSVNSLLPKVEINP